MTTIPLRNLLVRNLCKQAPGAEVLYSTYVESLESNGSKEIQDKFQKTIMDSYLNTCYPSFTDHRTCDAMISTFTDNAMSHNGSQSAQIDSNEIPGDDIHKTKQRYKAMRTWKRTGRGRQAINHEKNSIIRLFSYNILAQHLIEMHKYLYKHHDERCLNWEMRKPLLIQEILEAQATVICLQEMQQEHLADFVKPFEELGYNYLYKKRTNDKEDGLLLMYKSDTFNLVEFANVEFFQSGIELLSRDNVAIIVKLSLKDSPETQVVIATTHLLYNPKRNDVRLGQVQILMAELERIAFVENTTKGPKYLPIIISGDFNLPPYSGVYKFITEGSFKYVGKSRMLDSTEYRRLSNSLIPPHLHVTDSCQHYNILVKRLCNRGEGQVMLGNSENMQPSNVPHSSNENNYRKEEIDLQTQRKQQIKINANNFVSFGSGYLTHPFRLRSVYSHTDRNGNSEATTHQDGWITVDYIFYSDVELIERYSLPTMRQCKALNKIPNLGIGSDHLSIGATFLLRKK